MNLTSDGEKATKRTESTGSFVGQEQQLEEDEYVVDEDEESREEDEYLYETNRARQQIALSANNADTVLNDTSASDTNNRTTRRPVESEKPVGSANVARNSSSTGPKWTAAQSGAHAAPPVKLLSTFAEPLFALQHHPQQHSAGPASALADYVFRIRILTEDNIQLSEFELNVSCKRMSSTNAISNGINGTF